MLRSQSLAERNLSDLVEDQVTLLTQNRFIPATEQLVVLAEIRLILFTPCRSGSRSCRFEMSEGLLADARQEEGICHQSLVADGTGLFAWRAHAEWSIRSSILVTVDGQALPDAMFLKPI